MENAINKSVNKKNEFLTSIIIAVLIYVFLVFLNIVFPTQSDDLGKKLNGIQTVIDKYLHWNGRFGELLLVMFGAWLSSKPIFAFLNAITGTSVIMLIYLNIFGHVPRKNVKDITYFSVLFLFLLFDPVYIFGSLFYWAAGCFNYLLAWFLILLLITPVNFLWRNIEFSKRQNTFFLICGIPVGIFAGWSSEFGIVIILLWIVSIVFAKIKDKKLPLWYFTSLCALIAGWLILYLSPGVHERGMTSEDFYSISALLKAGPVDLTKRLLYTYDRLTYMSHSSLYYEYFIFISLFLVLTSVFYKPSVKKYIVNFLTIAVLLCMVRFLPKIFFILTLIVVCVLGYIRMKKEDKYISDLWLIMAVVLIAEFVFIGSTIQIGIPRRARMQFAILNMCLIAVNMTYCFKVFKDNEKVQKTTCIICVSLAILFSVFVCAEVVHMRLKWNAMEKSVAEQKAKGIMDVTVSKEYFKSIYWSYGDWGDPNEDATTWPNDSYARYYGVDTYTVK